METTKANEELQNIDLGALGKVLNSVSKSISNVLEPFRNYLVKYFEILDNLGISETRYLPVVLLYRIMILNNITGQELEEETKDFLTLKDCEQTKFELSRWMHNKLKKDLKQEKQEGKKINLTVQLINNLIDVYSGNKEDLFKKYIILKNIEDRLENDFDLMPETSQSLLNNFDYLQELDFYTSENTGVQAKLLKSIANTLEENNLKNQDQIILDSFMNFVPTSKESEFTKYPTDLEIFVGENRVKTADYHIEQKAPYQKTINGKKVDQFKTGSITACFIKPLDWLNNTYSLNIDDYSTDEEIKSEVKLTGHFEITQEETNFYNAICSILKEKYYKLKRSADIGIAFDEIHKQLGYKVHLKEKHKIKYKSLYQKLSNKQINIDFKKACYNKHEQFYKTKGNIEGEPLLVYKGFCKLESQVNNRKIKLDGFLTDVTNFMKFHFDYTKQYKVSEREPKLLDKKKSKLIHFDALNNYIQRQYFINKGNKNYAITRTFENIFEEMKEFNFKEEFDQTREKKKFIERKIINPIKGIPEIKSVKNIDNKKIEIYFNF